MFFSKGKQNQNVPADIVSSSESSTPAFPIGGTVEFPSGEDEVRVTLVVSRVWTDEKSGPCISLQRSPGMFTLPEMDSGSEVVFYTTQNGSRPYRCTGIVLNSSRIKADIGNISIEKMEERRSEYRIPVNGPVVLVNRNDSEKKLEAAIINVSSDGMSFFTKDELSQGDVFDASFRLYPGGAWTSASGQIVWVDPLPSGKTRYGMIFSLFTERQKSDFMAEMFRAQRSQRG